MLYYQPKNQQAKFCAIFFSKINPDCAHLDKNRYIHILQGGGGGVWGNSSAKPKKCKKMEAIPFLHQILHTRRIDSPVMMRILQRGAIHPLILNLGKGPVVE